MFEPVNAEVALTARDEAGNIVVAVTAQVGRGKIVSDVDFTVSHIVARLTVSFGKGFVCGQR